MERNLALLHRVRILDYKRSVNMDDDEFCYCHNDDTDEYHDCLDYMECEECPYYYADID